MGDAPVRVQRKHAVGDTLQDSLDMSAALLQCDVSRTQFATRGLKLSPARFEFLSHAVERMHQVANLVGSANFHPVIEASSRYFLSRLGKSDYRTCHQLGQK